MLSDAVIERIIGSRLDEQVPQSIENGDDLGGGLPVLGLEDGETDASEGVIGDVWVVDAGDELDDRGSERIVGGEGKDDAEFTGVEGGFGWRGEGDVPCVEGFGGGEGDGEAFGGVLADFGVFLQC